MRDFLYLSLYNSVYYFSTPGECLKLDENMKDSLLDDNRARETERNTIAKLENPVAGIALLDDNFEQFQAVV